MKKLLLIFLLFTTGIYSHDCKEPPLVVMRVDEVNKVSTPVLVDEKQKETVSKEEYKRLEALVVLLLEQVIKLTLAVERLEK